MSATRLKRKYWWQNLKVLLRASDYWRCTACLSVSALLHGIFWHHFIFYLLFFFVLNLLHLLCGCAARHLVGCIFCLVCCTFGVPIVWCTVLIVSATDVAHISWSCSLHYSNNHRWVLHCAARWFVFLSVSHDCYVYYAAWWSQTRRTYDDYLSQTKFVARNKCNLTTLAVVFCGFSYLK